jgi:hypothetical protein
MTYQELNDRLTNVQSALTSLQSGTYQNVPGINVQETISQLQSIKEALDSELKILAEQEAGTISTDSEIEAEKLAKKGINVKLTKEAKGEARFSVEETKQIARGVGKSLAKALIAAGDELSHMKAINIEEGSFNLHVEYKDNRTDNFSFYIEGEELHLVDFSYNKAVGEIGIKPSGEPVIHVDVIANELTKHFSSKMQEKKIKTSNRAVSTANKLSRRAAFLKGGTKHGIEVKPNLRQYHPTPTSEMTDNEFSDAQQADRLKNHPEKTTIEKIQALIATEKNKNKNTNKDSNTITFTLDDGYLDDKFLSDESLSRNLGYKKDGRDTYYVLPKRDFDRFQDWADSSGYDTDEVIDVIDEIVKENVNPELGRLVNGFIRKLADRYDYSLQDAVYAVTQVLRKQNYDGLNEGNSTLYKDSNTGKQYDIQKSGNKWEMDITKKDASIYDQNATSTIKRDSPAELKDWLDGYKIDSSWMSHLVKENEGLDQKEQIKFYNTVKPGDTVKYNGKDKNSFIKGTDYKVDHVKSDSLFTKTVVIKNGKLRLIVRGTNSILPSSSNIKENVNPELDRLVNGFIRKLADRYDYSLQDAVYAVTQVLRKQNYDGVNEITPAQQKYADKAASRPSKPKKTQFRKDIEGAKRMIDSGKSQQEVIKRFGIEAYNAVGAENEYLEERKIEVNEPSQLKDLKNQIEKYYSRKLEPSQINTMVGKDDKIANLLSKYKKLSKEVSETTKGNIVSEDLEEASGLEFKVGDKVKHLGHPGVITKAGTDIMDRPQYSVSYNKGTGDTKATNIYNKGGVIKKSIEEGKHKVKFSKSNNTYQVWKGDKIITDFATKKRAEDETKKLNLLSITEDEDVNDDMDDWATDKGHHIDEEKGTCCGKCGRVHVKGSKCKTPFLKGKDHCRTK